MAGTASEIAINGTPTGGGNLWIDSLVWGGAWQDDAALPTTGGPVTIAWAAMSGTDPLEALGSEGMTWSAAGLAALAAALAAWEAVAAIEFVEATSAEADVWLWQGTSEAAFGALGWSEVPGYSTGEPLFVVFNGADSSWSPSGLAVGGYGYITLIHELGHLLGLAHPHDGGAAGDGTVFPDVSGPFHDYGQYDLNQGIFTTMTYNDGWATEFPGHAALGYGWQASPMALDIAAIQAIYGANTTHASGADTYALPVVNGAGTFWRCIWDTGGTDLITNEGSALAATINLTAAPLTGPNAGGYVSRAMGIVGGYTIANGVVIENATGGGGHDTLTGNAAANVLIGGGGDDSLTGGDGNDTLTGGTGADSLAGGDGDDLLDGESGSDTMTGGGGDDVYLVDRIGDSVSETTTTTATDDAGGADLVCSAVTFSLDTHSGVRFVEALTLTGRANINGTGNALDNLITGNAGRNVLSGGAGADSLIGGAGHDIYLADAFDTIIELPGQGIDTVQTTASHVLQANIEKLTLAGSADIDGTGNSLDNVIAGNAGSNLLSGEDGRDTLNGGADDDTLIGGAGQDRLTGGTGADIFVFRLPTDSGTGRATRDTVTDFRSGIDRIDLSLIDANVAADGDQAFDFIGRDGFGGMGGQVRFARGVLSGDLDGDGIADFEIALSGLRAMTEGDFLL